MAWIESHEDLLNHPKTVELMTALNADLPQTIGVLHLLWHFTMKFSWRDGDLSKYTANSIAHFIGWTKNPDDLIKSLQKTGWLEDMKVHDWLDYAGKIVRDRIYNEHRKRRNTPSSDVNSRKTSATVPNRTVPNLTIPKESNRVGAFAPPNIESLNNFFKDSLMAQDFFDYYSSNGWKVGGRAPMKDWQAAARRWARNNRSKSGGRPLTKSQEFTRQTLETLDDETNS